MEKWDVEVETDVQGEEEPKKKQHGQMNEAMPKAEGGHFSFVEGETISVKHVGQVQHMLEEIALLRGISSNRDFDESPNESSDDSSSAATIVQIKMLTEHQRQMYRLSVEMGENFVGPSIALPGSLVIRTIIEAFTKIDFVALAKSLFDAVKMGAGD